MSRCPRIFGWGVVALVALAGCSGGASASPSRVGTAGATPTAGARLSSPAHLRIVEPQPGAVIHGSVVHVVVAVDNASVVSATSTRVTPTEGHVHLFLDGNLVYMNYSLTQDLPVHLGESGILRAEFVGADHFPFNPRVLTSDVFFTVR